MQAAILNIKINYLNNFIEKRKKIALRYSESLKNLPITLPKENKYCDHSYHLYVIRVSEKLRDKFIMYLKKKRINVGIHYYPPCHLMKNFKCKTNLLNTEIISKEIISLPNYPELSEKQLLFITSTIRKFFNSKK